MAELSDFLPSGGGSVLKSETMTKGRVSAGASGDVLTINVPADKVIKLSHLVMTGTAESNVQVEVDGTIFYTGTLDANSPNADGTNDNFGIGEVFGSGNPNDLTGWVASVVAKSQIIVRKTSGSLAGNLEYSYQTFGE